jgi:hypothetical protein
MPSAKSAHSIFVNPSAFCISFFQRLSFFIYCYQAAMHPLHVIFSIMVCSIFDIHALTMLRPSAHRWVKKHTAFVNAFRYAHKWSHGFQRVFYANPRLMSFRMLYIANCFAWCLHFCLFRASVGVSHVFPFSLLLDVYILTTFMHKSILQVSDNINMQCNNYVTVL